MDKGVYSGPTGLKMMESAIQAYCGMHGLQSEIDRQAVANRVIDFYSQGLITTEAVLTALARQDGAS